MNGHDRRHALEAASRYDARAAQGGPDAEAFADAARMVRALLNLPSLPRNRISPLQLAGALQAAWPKTFSDVPLPPAPLIESLAVATLAELSVKPPAAPGEIRLNYRQVGYLKEMAGSYGLERGRTHPTMVALAKHDLVFFERRHWKITDKGRQWLAQNIPDFKPPNS